eukprot:Anaeramoba_ignava/a90049_29.p1 GENE.a90049_29~~a90049_29.p1  ORF type:complete len:493 (-),score=164.45 a90049_29:111-1589(-)
MSKTIEEVLRNLVNQKDIADVKFLVGHKEEEMYGHKVLLSTASEYWMRMFYGLKWKEVSQKRIAEVVVPDFQAETFIKVMEYVYTREINIDSDSVFDVLRAADKYIILGLVDICVEVLMKNINQDNCFQILEFGKYFSTDQLVKKTTDFISENSIDLLTDSQALVNFSRETIKEILMSNSITIREFELFQQIVEWGRNQIKSTGNSLYEEILDLLPYIKVDIMNKKEIQEVFDFEFFNTQEMIMLLQEKANEKETRNEGRRGKPPIRLDEISVLIFSSDDRSDYFQNITNSIKEGGILTIETLDGKDSTPEIEILLQYDVIFVFSDSNWKDNTAVSEVLFQFCSFGGGLVVCAPYLLATRHEKDNFVGEIINDFIPFQKSTILDQKSNLKMGKFDPNHILMEGVDSFNGGTLSLCVNSQNIYDGEVVAFWDNEIPLIIHRKPKEHSGEIVVLNFFPISDKNLIGGWLSQTDGSRIISNAIRFAANRSSRSAF